MYLSIDAISRRQRRGDFANQTNLLASDIDLCGDTWLECFVVGAWGEGEIDSECSAELFQHALGVVEVQGTRGLAMDGACGLATHESQRHAFLRGLTAIDGDERLAHLEDSQTAARLTLI